MRSTLPAWLAGFWASSAVPILWRVGMPMAMMILPSRLNAMRAPDVPCDHASETNTSVTSFRTLVPS